MDRAAVVRREADNRAKRSAGFGGLLLLSGHGGRGSVMLC